MDATSSDFIPATIAVLLASPSALPALVSVPPALVVLELFEQTPELFLGVICE